MKVIRLLICLNILFGIFSCRSTVKEQKDKLYSRHLQRYVDLTIVSTAMPDKKEKMNLIICNGFDFLKKTRSKEIIDSLYNEKKIQPLLLVGITGIQNIEIMEADDSEAKQYKKYNDFIIRELYPFVKKKSVIRKFNSVAIGGLGILARRAFDIAWSNDDKVGIVGMFDPDFGVPEDSSILQEIKGLRKRPNLKLWIAADKNDSMTLSFKKIIDGKKSISDCTLTERNVYYDADFAAFLLWAFPK